MKNKIKKGIACGVLALSILATPLMLSGCKETVNTDSALSSSSVYGIEYQQRSASVSERSKSVDDLWNAKRNNKLKEGDKYAYELSAIVTYSVSIDIFVYNSKEIDFLTTKNCFAIKSNNESITFDDGLYPDTTKFVSDLRDTMTFKANTLNIFSFTGISVSSTQKFRYYATSSSNYTDDDKERYNQFVDNLSNDLKETTFSIYLGEHKIGEFKCEIK